MSTPKQKKDDFEALFKGIFKRKISTVKIAKIYSQITIAAWMQPLQYDLRCSAAKDNSITHAAAAPSNLDAATTMRSAETELQNTKELRATASETAAPKRESTGGADSPLKTGICCICCCHICSGGILGAHGTGGGGGGATACCTNAEGPCT
jgi:hypothetical protein